MNQPNKTDAAWAKAAVAALIARCVRSLVAQLEADARELKKWGAK